MAEVRVPEVGQIVIIKAGTTNSSYGWTNEMTKLVGKAIVVDTIYYDKDGSAAYFKNKKHTITTGFPGRYSWDFTDIDVFVTRESHPEYFL